jgi:hypothetical protein
MKLPYHLPALACFLFIACNNTATKSKAPAVTDTSAIEAKSPKSTPLVERDTITATEAEDEWLPRYVLVTDTGNNYFALQKQMVAQAHLNGLRIDSMGRFYDAKKNLIRLPDNSDDEIYAGDYFPRRDDNEYLSIEYLNTYKGDAKEKTMAVIAGIYISKSGADSAYARLNDQKSFILKTDIYQGCMH